MTSASMRFLRRIHRTSAAPTAAKSPLRSRSARTSSPTRPSSSAALGENPPDSEMRILTLFGDMVSQHLLGKEEVKGGVDIAGPLLRDDPGTAVASLQRVLFHEDCAARQVNRALAQIQFGEVLPALAFEFLHEWWVGYPAVRRDEFH